VASILHHICNYHEPKWNILHLLYVVFSFPSLFIYYSYFLHLQIINSISLHLSSLSLLLILILQIILLIFLSNFLIYSKISHLLILSLSILLFHIYIFIHSYLFTHLLNLSISLYYYSIKNYSSHHIPSILLLCLIYCMAISY